MKLNLLAGTRQCATGDCPTTYETETGSAAVQGYRLGNSMQIDLPSTHAALEVPVELLADTEGNIIDGSTGQILLGDGGSAFGTERNTVVITGRRVTDPEALQAMGLAANEEAVEISPEMLQQAVLQIRYAARREAAVTSGSLHGQSL